MADGSGSHFPPKADPVRFYDPAAQVQPQTPKAGLLLTQAELDKLIEQAVDRDRIAGFMLFSRSLHPTNNTLIYGTSLQARSIMRALEQLGY